MRLGSWKYLILAAICAPAPGAEFKVVNREALPLARIAAGECSVVLSGTINPGDAAKLNALLANGEVKVEVHPTDLSFTFDANEPKSTSLCLDSSGGSFQEAQELIKAIRENDLVTVVPDRSTCLSACAMAFLAGQISSFMSDGGQVTPYRVLHIRGRLGFHAPFPKINHSGSIPVAAAMDFYKGGIQSVADLSDVLVGWDTYEATARFPQDLMLEMLARFGPDSLYYIDTVDQAGRYDIRLAGVPAIALDWDALVRLCDNVTSWTWGLKGPEAPDSSLFNLEISPDPNKTTIEAAMKRKSGITVGSRHARCSILTKPNPGDDFAVSFVALRMEERERPLEPWHSLPHYVTLDQLVAAGLRFDPAAFESKYSSPDFAAVDVERHRLTNLTPNQVIFLNCESEETVSKCGNTESSETMIIALGAGSDAEIRWADGRHEAFTYVFKNGSVCFKGKQEPGKSFCGSMSMDQYSSLNWHFDDSSLPRATVQFARPGAFSFAE